MLLIEQLYYNIDKNVVRTIFLYIKNCLLSDFIWTHQHYGNKDVEFLIKNFNVKPKPVISHNTIIPTLKNLHTFANSVLMRTKQNVFSFKASQFVNDTKLEKVKLFILFAKFKKFNAAITQINPTEFYFSISKDYLLKYFGELDGFNENEIIQRLNYALKNLYTTIYHELTHISQDIDIKNTVGIPEKSLEFITLDIDKYYLRKNEFATYLSNAYSEIKRLTNSGRKKLSQKEFNEFCHGKLVRGSINRFMGALAKEKKVHNSKRWLIAKDRLYNLCINTYLNRDK